MRRYSTPFLAQDELLFYFGSLWWPFTVVEYKDLSGLLRLEVDLKTIIGNGLIKNVDLSFPELCLRQHLCYSGAFWNVKKIAEDWLPGGILRLELSLEMRGDER